MSTLSACMPLCQKRASDPTLDGLCCHVVAGNWIQVLSGRAISALNHWAISLAPTYAFYVHVRLCFQGQPLSLLPQGPSQLPWFWVSTSGPTGLNSAYDGLLSGSMRSLRRQVPGYLQGPQESLQGSREGRDCGHWVLTVRLGG